ncbi:MAG: FAD-dependent oxidoreductase [Spirochaetaceae bacterium]|nr:MAG: FAD-dependent oxidoreductase [Spirochaetaceae bacterium]
MPEEQNAQTVLETAKKTPIVESADVVVCGGGPAGTAAAISAARSGARVRLLENHGCLGGIWTSGQLSWMIDSYAKTGIMKEIVGTLISRGAAAYARNNSVMCDTEELKLLLDELVIEAGVKVQLHTRVVAAVTDESGRVRYVVTESKSGRQAWSADVFVDATGDGDLSAFAGSGYDIGDPETGEVQPMSMIALLGGLDPDEAVLFNNRLEYSDGTPKPKQRLRAEIERAGLDPSYTMPALFHMRDDLFIMMANHEYGVSALDAQAISDATFRARGEVHRIVSGLRSLGGVWRNIRVVATAEQIGVREARRVRGLYTVSRDDLIAGTRHDDAVCRVTFGFDVHSPDPGQSRDGRRSKIPAKPYDIPLRSLIVRDVKALLVAGRCISGDFWAHSSYRVTGDAVELGQAAGVAAAVAARERTSTHDLSWAAVKPELEKVRVEATARTPEAVAVSR